MAGFELQGTKAASSEPFGEWCDQHGVDLRIHSAARTNDQLVRDTWNSALEATRIGNKERAQSLLRHLEELEHTHRQQ